TPRRIFAPTSAQTRLMSDDSSPTDPLPAPVDPMDRRDFLRFAGVGAGVLLATGCATSGPAQAPARGVAPARSARGSGHIVVIGGGAWGGWTSLYLRRRGARVTMIDAYGPGNSKASSGDETRGVR